jgi:hypothetical protein
MSIFGTMKNNICIIGFVFFVALVGVGIFSRNSKPFKSTTTESHHSYTVRSDSVGKTYTVDTPNEYSFSVVDDRGTIVKEFTSTHTKLMHVIVVRKDLSYFQHVHPEFDQATGMFTLKDLIFPTDGQYRIFTDFAVANNGIDSMGMPLMVVQSEDVSVGSMANYKPQPIGNEEKTKTFNGIQVTRNTHGMPSSKAESMLMFNLSQNGKSITDLEPYLGALGHAVILREGTLDFIHAHPVEEVGATQTGNVDFMVDFPEAGKYKVFTQFQKDGKVLTTDFVITVGQGIDSGTPQKMHMDMPEMHHQ